MPPHPCLNCGHLVPKGKRCSCQTTRGRGYGTEWRKLSALVIERDKACVDSGHTGSAANPLTADHVWPKSRGGLDTLDNLVCRCRRHNSAKATKFPRVQK